MGWIPDSDWVPFLEMTYMIFLLETTHTGSPNLSGPSHSLLGIWNLNGRELSLRPGLHWFQDSREIYQVLPSILLIPSFFPTSSTSFSLMNSHYFSLFFWPKLASICFLLLASNEPDVLPRMWTFFFFFIIISVAVGEARPQEKKINSLPNTCRPGMEPCFRNRDQLLVADCW